jgi:hypothetical protein
MPLCVFVRRFTEWYFQHYRGASRRIDQLLISSPHHPSFVVLKQACNDVDCWSATCSRRYLSSCAEAHCRFIDARVKGSDLIAYRRR